MRCVYAPTMLMRLITLVFGRIRLRRAYSVEACPTPPACAIWFTLCTCGSARQDNVRGESLLHGGGLLEGL
jgi:hypothetical protein